MNQVKFEAVCGHLNCPRDSSCASLILSDFLAVKLKNCIEGLSDTLAFHLTIPANTTITLVDDLEKLPYSTINLTITLHENSNLTYTSSVIDSDRHTLAGNELTSTVINSHEKLTKNIKFIFAGPHAKASITCTYLAGKQRSFKLVTLQDHRSPDTSSSLTVKGVFEGKTHFFCDNLITIHKDAQRVDAFQVNKNLLLSDQARAISIPKMEVEANDVSCKHGSATSRINPEQLFYLQSRGMDAVQSKELLIQAFLG